MRYRRKIEKELIEQYLNLNGSVLDIGGDNKYIEKFQEKHTCNIIKLDIKNFKLCDLNKEELPYVSTRFDNIVITHVLEHVENIFHVMRECKRVLKNDGLICISIPNPNTLISKLKFIFKDQISTVYLPIRKAGHINAVHPYLIKEYLTKHLGLKLIHESYNGGTIPIIRKNIKFSKLFGRNYSIILKKIRRE